VRAPSATSPARLLAESAKSLRRLLPEDISIELEIAAELPTGLVDAAQLSHVLLNLGVNAKDAMPAGGVLTFGAACIEHDALPEGLGAREGARRWVHVWVRDTGVGMSAETLAHIFEPFFTTKGERGTGLGLATSYAMVHQNGGLIHVRSEEGKGTELGIYLPEHGAPIDAAAPSKPARLERGAVVMVAEDDADVRESLVRVLGAAGFRVFPSADAASAMELLERVGGAVDVLCTDGIMPGGGTRALIDKYRSQSPGGQVILCSGYVQEELLRREIDAGAFAYLPKPFLPSELVDRINTLLSASAEQQRGEGR
jgi:CheY-like chemotaxis protein